MAGWDVKRVAPQDATALGYTNREGNVLGELCPVAIGVNVEQKEKRRSALLENINDNTHRNPLTLPTRRIGMPSVPLLHAPHGVGLLGPSFLTRPLPSIPAFLSTTLQSKEDRHLF